MSEFIDLSHVFEDGMPGFRMIDDTGEMIQYKAKIYPFLTHDQTRSKFKDNVSFEITQIEFQSSIGTYLDSPYHRFPNKRDISQIRLKEVILNGIVIDCRDYNPDAEIQLDDIHITGNLKGKAVLFNFGWDKYWGSEQYYSYPFISSEIINYLINEGVKLVGVDSINIDNSEDLTRPAHSKFLNEDVLLVENLCSLDKLLGMNFRFFAVPIKGKSVAAMPVRAFAEIF